MHDEYDFSKLDDEVQIKAGILAPVAYGSLTLKDIISEFDSTSLITTDPDGLLQITYEDSLLSYSADDILKIPSQDFINFFIKSDVTIQPGYPGWTNPGDILPIDKSEKYPFTFDHNERLDSMIVDQATLVFNINSSFHNEAKIILKCPNIRINNEIFTDTIITDASGSFSDHRTRSLEGYTIYLDDAPNTDTMYIPVDFHVDLINSGMAITENDSINVDAKIEDIDFDAIFGYVGNYNLISQSGDIDLSFFENSLDGHIRFANPQVKFHIINSFGVPAAVNISRFTGFKGSDSLQLTFNSNFDNPFSYAHPTLDDYSNNDIYKEKTISIDSSNSNIADFLDSLPSKIEYNLSAESNPVIPGFDDIDPSNFISDESKLKVNFEFILPMYFEADNFALKDTMDLDLSDIGDDADFIDKVNITLNVSNGLPLDIDFQVYFVDSLYNTVDTLFASNNQPIINSGIVDPMTHKVALPGEKSSTIEYTGERIKALSKVRYAIVRAGLKTPDINEAREAVKFFTDYSVDFNLNVQVDVNANSNDF